VVVTGWVNQAMLHKNIQKRDDVITFGTGTLARR
jgi:hypothetical protein